MRSNTILPWQKAMIENIVSMDLPVHEKIVVNKNSLRPEITDRNTKRLSIVTGIHGDELDGQYVCYEIVKRISEQPENLKGIVDIYPAINPLGLDSGVRGIPMFDLDMNRVFPGIENGAMAEYIASKVVNDIIGSDLCIDIHSSNIFLKETPQVRVNEDTADKLLDYAKCLNVDFVWVFSSITVLDATLAYSLNKLGVPTLVAEMGVGLRIDYEYCRQMTEGIFNLMKAMGIWIGETTSVKKPIMSTEGAVTVFHSEVSGMFVSYIHKLGPVKKDEHIGDVIEPISGKVLQSVYAPADGIIFTLREHPIVYKGAILARVHGGSNG